MNETTKNNVSKIPWAITVLFFSSTYISRANIYGAYILFGVTILMFFACAIENNWKISFHFGPFHRSMFLFALYCVMSSLWGLDAQDPLVKGITIFEILVCLSVFYAYFSSKDDGFQQLLRCVLWTGYIVTIYTFVYYGSQTVSMILHNAGRLESGFNNVNEMATLYAVTIVLTLYFWINEKFSLYMLLSFPSLILLVASGSKRALIILLMGIIIVLFGKSENKQQHSILKRAIVIIAIVAAVSFFISNNLLSGMNERLGYLLSLVFGNGKTDNSTLLRQQFIIYGFQVFIENPIFGVGVGCPHILVATKFGLDVYLHNNFVELLAGGGIVGFLLFYRFYYYILRGIRRNRVDKQTRIITLFIVCTLLITDIASGSYYSKETYFLLMVCFIWLDKVYVRNEEVLK